jgi:hypothetical protein
MPNVVRNEKSQDECCEPGQGEGDGGLFKCQVARLQFMRVFLRCSGLGDLLPFWDSLT